MRTVVSNLFQHDRSIPFHSVCLFYPFVTHTTHTRTHTGERAPVADPFGAFCGEGDVEPANEEEAGFSQLRSRARARSSRRCRQECSCDEATVPESAVQGPTEVRAIKEQVGNRSVHADCGRAGSGEVEGGVREAPAFDGLAGAAADDANSTHRKGQGRRLQQLGLGEAWREVELTPQGLAQRAQDPRDRACCTQCWVRWVKLNWIGLDWIAWDCMGLHGMGWDGMGWDGMSKSLPPPKDPR